MEYNTSSRYINLINIIIFTYTIFTLIVIIIDANYMSHYLEILAQMKTIGNRIVAIGLEDNWEFLLALASIGFDRRKNLYLFNDGNLAEFDTIIEELHS